MSKPLKSEACSDRHRFIDLDGNNSQGHQVIFPIIKENPDSILQLIGTGFFISSCGLFASAKHVLRDCFDQDGSQKYPILLVHFLPNRQYQFRHIVWCSFHEICDVAVGLVEPAGGIEINAVLQLTISVQSNGSTCVTYAYPKTDIQQVSSTQVLNFKPDFYDGRIVQHQPQGRDKIVLPGPCYQTSMVIRGGASGGPVIGKSGRVFAINSTGYDGADDISFVSRIDEIVNLMIPSINLPNGQVISSVAVGDLARSGWIDLEEQPTSE